MKKIYFLLFSTLLLRAASAQGPALSDNTNVKRCATVEVLAEARRNHPGAETDAQFESWINQAIQQRNIAGRVNTNYNLPVVFHIISNGEAVGTNYNIAASAITQQMLQINKDYANLSNSPYAVSTVTGLQFSLCQKDPYNNVLAEPGIDRINRNIYGWTDPAAGWSTTYITNTIKPSTIWDPARYLNIWIVPYMPGTTAGTEILGFATFPASSTLSGLSDAETNTTAGVVIKYTTVGSIFQPVSCTVAYGKGKTLSHELGHFFGLRHIWGDANCATDYVNDTPVHYDANSGVPTHPKPNICGTADEMFENYMDYSDDIVLNTFTANQVDRMQTVMTNSPRRNTLPTSNVGFTPVTATNRISFSDCSGATTVSEAGNTGTYPRYRSINLYLNVEDKATGAATVAFVASGTAVSGKDYNLPASVTFASGDTYKPIALNILDNATVDGTRTLTLSYTISGSGVTAGTAAQTITITINDDDNIAIGQSTINALSENFETGTGGTYNFPSGWGLLLTSGYVNRYTNGSLGNAGGTGNAAYITNDYLGTKANTYTKGVSGAAVLVSPVIDPTRYQSLGTLNFKYRVGGNATDYAIATYNYPSVYTFYYFGTTGGASGYGPYNATGATPVSGSPTLTVPANLYTTKFNISFYWTTGTATGGIDPGFNVDDVTLTALPFPVETVVASSYGYDVPASSFNIFRTTNNKAVATISAPSAALTNVTAAVTEAGTDRPTFSANGTTYMRTRKVVTVASNPANSTAQYSIKLYFTAAELAAWGAAAIPNLKVMRVNAGVSLSSALNNSNAKIFATTSVVDSSSAAGYYAFAATVTGQGQFVLVAADAALPVKLLSFTGVLDKNQTRLNWATTAEVNNLGFAVERSTDAATFAQIGWVDASASNKYELFDASITKGNKYYYRLKQVDRDGNATYSPVVTIAYLGNGSITVFPNPVKNDLVIQQSGNSRTSVVVTDLAGKTVYSNTFSAGTLQINAQPWSKGVYMVRVIGNNNEESTFKVIKE